MSTRIGTPPRTARRATPSGPPAACRRFFSAKLLAPPELLLTVELVVGVGVAGLVGVAAGPVVVRRLGAGGLAAGVRRLAARRLGGRAARAGRLLRPTARTVAVGRGLHARRLSG